MKKLRVSSAMFLGMVLSGIGSGFFLGYVVGYRFPFKADKDIVDVVTAIGTVGAVVVALYLGVKGLQSQRRDQIARTHLAAAGLVHDLVGLRASVRALHKRLDRYDDATDGAETHFPETWYFHVVRGHAVLRSEPASFLPLYTLDGKAATLLMGSVARLRKIDEEIRALAVLEPDWAQVRPDVRQSIVRNWTKYLKAALPNIERGIEVLRSELKSARDEWEAVV